MAEILFLFFFCCFVSWLNNTFGWPDHCTYKRHWSVVGRSIIFLVLMGESLMTIADETANKISGKKEKRKTQHGLMIEKMRFNLRRRKKNPTPRWTGQLAKRVDAPRPKNGKKKNRQIRHREKANRRFEFWTNIFVLKGRLEIRIVCCNNQLKK